MKYFSIFLLSLALRTAGAAECGSPIQPQNYLVFSGTNIRYRGSDFQGATGAVGDVKLDRFWLNSKVSGSCASLAVGGNLELVSGKIDGQVTAGGDVSYSEAQVKGETKHGGALYRTQSQINGHESIDPSKVKRVTANAWKFFVEQSKDFARKQPNSTKDFFGGILSLVASSERPVFEISASDISKADVIRLSATGKGPFIVNIRGKNAQLIGKDIQLRGDLKPGQIFFNFPDAKTLDISESGGADFGIPATILAPQANLNFSRARITGGVYVGNLSGNGQINFAKPAWPVQGQPVPVSCGEDAAGSTPAR